MPATFRLRIKAALNAPDILTALDRTLSDIESIACDYSAYGMHVENPEHPWHETVMNLRAAIAKLEG